jgi:hypothetical protein
MGSTMTMGTAVTMQTAGPIGMGMGKQRRHHTSTGLGSTILAAMMEIS